MVSVLRVGGDFCLNFAEGVRSCQLRSGTSMNRMESVFISSTLPCVTRGDSDESGWRLSLNIALINKHVMLIVRGTQPDNGAVTMCRCQTHGTQPDNAPSRSIVPRAAATHAARVLADALQFTVCPL